MVKLVSDKGFTLIEMLLILMALSLMLVLFPIMKPQMAIQLQYEMYTMKQILLQTQMQALIHHQNEQVSIRTNSIVYLNTTYQLTKGIQCDPTVVTYYANGNIAQAKTIRCSCEGERRRLILELGSGSIYVK